MSKSQKLTYTAPAVVKAFEILDLLQYQPGGALISEMANILHGSVGELFRIVVVLEQMGYLQKSPKDDRYTVAYKLLDLAMRATPGQDLVVAARPGMRQLAIDTGQSCHLVVVNGGSGLVISSEQNPGTRGFSLRLGAAIDMLASCSGHILLAFAPEDQRGHIVAHALAEAKRPFDQPALERRLAAIQKRGFEQRKSPITRGVTDISYPIFGRDGLVTAALTIPFLELIDGSERVGISTARDKLKEASRKISTSLGYPSR